MAACSPGRIGRSLIDFSGRRGRGPAAVWRSRLQAAGKRLRRDALVLVSLLGIPAATAEVLSGQVTGVTDGDTIIVRGTDAVEHTVRLAGIDAPEYTQPHGRRARSNLAALIAGKSVTVEYRKRDRWQRLVGRVYFEGRDVNLKQVIDGYAWHFRRFGREQGAAERQLYRSAEKHARAQRIGLWVDPRPVPPWKWRMVKRGATHQGP